jgi:hypothetical protein
MTGSVRVILQVFLLGGLLLIGQGAWLIAESRLPSWMKGIWKWPLGESHPAAVANLLGWASLLVGAACVPTLVFLGLWDLSTTSRIAQIASSSLVGAGSFALAWSVFFSRRKLA